MITILRKELADYFTSIRCIIIFALAIFISAAGLFAAYQGIRGANLPEGFVFLGLFTTSGEVIPHLTPDEARSLIASRVASGGMIPKLEACMRALSVVPVTRIIDGRIPHVLLDEIKNKDGGTTICRSEIYNTNSKINRR